MFEYRCKEVLELKNTGIELKNIYIYEIMMYNLKSLTLHNMPIISQ